MAWLVDFHRDFHPVYMEFNEETRLAIAAAASLLKDQGPFMKRPLADTLKGSRHANMKELRITVSDGEWRVAYAFSPGAARHFACRGQQVGKVTAVVLQGFDQEGRQALCRILE